MSDDTERERAKYEALAALVDNYRRERDEAREQLYVTKAELGRWVDRETKAARERDEARELYEDCLICNRNLFGIINDRTEERDEARAEVSRLQEDRDKWRDRYHAMRTDVGLSGDVEDEITCAYRRGAKAMREACAQWVDHWVSGHVADKLRDMPIPEEP